MDDELCSECIYLKYIRTGNGVFDPIDIGVVYEHGKRMMTSSNGNIFRVTGPLCGGITGHRWISHTKANDAGLWCFLWSAPD